MYLLDTHAIIWYVTGSDVERIKNLPDIHKDPFDRLLIAQTIENKFTMITRDAHIPLYAIKTIW